MTEMEAQKAKIKKRKRNGVTVVKQQRAFESNGQTEKINNKKNTYQRPAMCAINHAALAVIS